MNELEQQFRTNTGRLIHKWHHYFDIYDRHFSRWRGKDVVVVEIGVAQGGSLEMWKKYFGLHARIYGVDIDPRCKMFEEGNVRIFIGSQSDRNFLKELRQEIPRIDILIDDGGHTMKQQITTFEELFYHLGDNGVYLCEDCHTSYWRGHGGGYRRKGSFIEYSKNWIDYLNAYHSKSRRLKVNDFTRHAHSVHYYDSVVVVEKALKQKPIATQTGTRTFRPAQPSQKVGKKITTSLRERLAHTFKNISNLLSPPGQGARRSKK